MEYDKDNQEDDKYAAARAHTLSQRQACTLAPHS